MDTPFALRALALGAIVACRLRLVALRDGRRHSHWGLQHSNVQSARGPKARAESIAKCLLSGPHRLPRTGPAGLRALILKLGL